MQWIESGGSFYYYSYKMNPPLLKPKLVLFKINKFQQDLKISLIESTKNIWKKFILWKW